MARRPACGSRRSTRGGQAPPAHGPERRRDRPGLPGAPRPWPAQRACPCITMAAALTTPPSPGVQMAPRRHTSLGLSPRREAGWLGGREAWGECPPALGWRGAREVEDMKL